ncbi:MAG: hypothetical protein ACYDB0_00715 [Acidithiobacillus sp.]
MVHYCINQQYDVNGMSMIKRPCSSGKASFNNIDFLRRVAIFRSCGANEFAATIKAKWCEDTKDFPDGDFVCSTFASGVFVSGKIADKLKECYPDECIFIPVEVGESSDIQYRCMVCRFDADHHDNGDMNDKNIFVTSDCPGIVVSDDCLRKVESVGVSGLDVRLWRAR